MSATSQHQWFVVCDSYTAGPFSTEESARRKLDGIEKLGECQSDHRVEQR